METQIEFEKGYANLLRDSNYEQLSLAVNEPNIFRVLGLEDYEIRHSSFLAWLLNPHETHGLGDVFLSRFLQDVLLDTRSNDISIVELSSLDNSKVEVRREWKNIDLLVITKNFVVCIENKMWSGEHSDQLNKYKNIIDKHFPHCKKVFVFLSPHGGESSEKEVYINYSYKRISEILSEIIDVRQGRIQSSVLTYLKDYNQSIKQNIMKDDTVNQLARQLYINHQELFDFVLQNKPNEWNELAEILTEKCKAKGWIIGSKNAGYVRFLTPAIEPYILKYNIANGWPNKEAFLFEFEFYEGKKIQFKVSVSDAVEDQSYDKRIVEILKEIEGVRTKIGEKWKTFFIESKNWEIKQKMRDWDSKKEKEIDAFIESIDPIVKKVESKILEYKEELEQLKKNHENK